ncbi:MAG: OmpA family protein [Bacteroidetes bacterium]|nr:OmpA family protein [Bacteroidota bacterium]
MSRKIIPLLCLFALMGINAQAQANYRVQVTVFDSKVPVDYFDKLEDVTILKDHNDLFRVYKGKYATRAEAESAAKETRAKGYPYASVIDMEALREACSASCQDPLYIQNIFFDYDKAYLRSKSKVDLSKLASLLMDNPGYKVEFTAHTDSHGSDDYNVNLSERRAESAKNYVINKGISADRILTNHSGEISPIAKNELGDGKDSPKGRQFNRRVEVTVIDSDGKIVSNIVQDINVPSILRL